MPVSEVDHDDRRRGLLQSTVDVFLDRTRAVAELVASAGSTAVGGLPAPLPDTVAHMLSALEQLVDQVPPITAELDVLTDELHAKRLSIRALQAELAALDGQLDVLERSLAPLRTWAHQWNRVRGTLTVALGGSTGPGPSSLATTTSGPGDARGKGSR